MAEYVKVVDLLGACVEAEYLGRPRMMVSASKIAQLPSVEIPQWIPCSERLPEENVAVLTQAKFKDDIKMAVSARQDYNYWTGWGTREVNIVAWMPLPKCYEKAVEK